jgi:hypothetical protein
MIEIASKKWNADDADLADKSGLIIHQNTSITS